jgi:hypothetical protein
MELLALLIFPLMALVLFVVWKLFSATVLREIGRRGVANTPAEIHLERTSLSSDAEARIRGDRGQLVALGFEEVGDFSVREMPGVSVSILVHPPSSVVASIYVHPRAGSWSELLTRYEDGSAASASSVRTTGLNPRPGHLSIREHGARVDSLYRRLLTERPQKPMRSVSPSSAVAEFERGYAEELAYRRTHSPTMDELRAVARLRSERSSNDQ